MEASGAPSYFWAEAMHHFVFTKNVLPTIPVQVDGKTEYKSPHNILNPGARPFNLDYLVAFGTLSTCIWMRKRELVARNPRNIALSKE